MANSLTLAKSSSSRDSSSEQASGHWSHWSDEVIQVAWKLFAQYPSSLTELADISESPRSCYRFAALGTWDLPDSTRGRFDCWKAQIWDEIIKIHHIRDFWKQILFNAPSSNLAVSVGRTAWVRKRHDVTDWKRAPRGESWQSLTFPVSFSVAR